MSTLVHSGVVAETKQGSVRGAMINGIVSFKGLPYAAPPFGAFRFEPPQPVRGWSGVRDALTVGAKPPQNPYPPPWDVLLPEAGEIGEDCLNLNIWTPDLSANLPVMVWIPGGMFEAGAGGSYDGSHFARDGVVCVTINYRVGPDGFLYLGTGTANRGLLDQIAALEWVQENISSFGGDPSKVTVFGESAGAMSIGTLLSMPQAVGLFRGAIVQSGGAQQVQSTASAQFVARKLAECLQIEPTYENFAGVPVERLLKAQGEMKGEIVANPDPNVWGAEVVVDILPWQPVVDGSVIRTRPLDAIANGLVAEVDLLVGSNQDESNFFLVPDGMIDQIAPEMVAGAAAAYRLPEDALRAFRHRHPAATDGELFSALQSDWSFRIPAMRLADVHAMSHAATYMYEFCWRSSAFDGRLGACHGLEIPFVFDVLPKGPDPLLGPCAPQALADAMHTAWLNFGHDGNPGWPAYDLQHRRTMRFDAVSEIVDDPLSTERAIWQGTR